MNAAFVVMLTFAGVSAHAQHTYYKVCPDQACVDDMIGEAHKSPYLARIRVFPADKQAISPLAPIPFYEPDLDLTFS